MVLHRVAPSTEEKLAFLGERAVYDLSCACGTEPSRRRGVDGRWIYPVALPSGSKLPMLKVLLQGGCERGCAYCAERQGGTGRSAAFSPDELAALFAELHRQRRVFGLFLSSAIRGGAVATMDRLLATAELVRSKKRFRGYLHLKILPGSRPDQVERAMSLATRVSVNLEAPTAAHLAQVAPGKQFEAQLLRPMRQVARAAREGHFRRAGQTTQLVVGAADERDRDILRQTAALYGELQLSRVYYSAFQPVPGTPLAHRSPAPFWREHRLYQADFLLRRYGFTFEELPFDAAGGLSPTHDPKTLWAQSHPERFPIEVNRAPLEELLRVPGIGPRSARRLLELRRGERLRELDDLRAAGARATLAAPYVLLDGRAPIPRQLVLALGEPKAIASSGPAGPRRAVDAGGGLE